MTIITAAEIQKGDLIKVTIPEKCEDRKTIRTHEGVAAQYDFDKWYTAEGWQLFTDQNNAVIELLDRPKPKIVLPTGTHAVIEFNKTNTLYEKRRVAVLNEKGIWHSYYPSGEWRDQRDSERLTQWFTDGHATDLKVVFAGVAK